MRTAGIIKAVQLTGNIDKLGSDKLDWADFLSTFGRLGVGPTWCWANEVQSCTKDLLMMLFVSIEQ